MTGGLVVEGVGAAHYYNYKVGGEGQEWPPKYAKLELELTDGGRVAFCDSRRFGKVTGRQAGSRGSSPLPAA